MTGTAVTTVFDFEARGIDGQPVALSRFRGQVLLVVNVASRCGYTGQYAALEAIHRRYRQRGFSVLGFPCNQFGRQEPGREEEILSFCRDRYDVTFPMFGKVDVNGRGAHPLFQFLKTAKAGFLGSDAIKWNFTKFLVGRDGHPLKRYGSRTVPDVIEPDIITALDS